MTLLQSQVVRALQLHTAVRVLHVQVATVLHVQVATVLHSQLVLLSQSQVVRDRQSQRVLLLQVQVLVNCVLQEHVGSGVNLS